MELKVWVDGIKRVVCGVTDNTTCQDIVIALAQAMGRTGRFTLIEKWRENERPLAPTECPLLVLQKWGEFASEVKLVLYESGTRRKQKQIEKENVLKAPDRFTHNFTPPVKTSEAVIRRSLTFSGGRKQESGGYSRPEFINFQRQNVQGPESNQHQSRRLQVPEKVTSDGNSWSSSSSLSSQNSTMAQQQQPQRRRSSSHDRMTSSHDRQRPSPSFQTNPTVPYAGYGPQYSNQVPQIANKAQQFTNQGPQFQQSASQKPAGYNSIPVNSSSNPNNYTHQNQTHSINSQTKYNNNVPISNGPVKPSSNRPVVNGPIHSSAFSPVQPRKNNFEGKRESPKISEMDIPIYTERRKSSHKHDLEEYDLDTNFPDVVKETGQDRLIEEFRMPGQGHIQQRNLISREEEERVKLLRLVTMQNERIRMQDSQLEIIDTEISSREQKHADLKLELNHITEEIAKTSEISKKHEEEIRKLDNGTLIDEIEHEKQAEREIKSEISSLRTRLEKCENDLQQFQSKVQTCSQELEKEHEVLKSDEKRRREEEIKLEAEISELRKEVDVRSKDLDEKTKMYENVEKELKSVSEQLQVKTDDLTATEKELQRENLKFFQHPQNTDGSKGSSSSKSEGEAVIKVLEGSITPKLKRNKVLASPLTILEMTRKESGVWV